MREIKFRAWQPHNSLHRRIGMYEVESLEFYTDNEITGEAFLKKPGEEKAKSSEYINEIVLMQYTGLKDKNGVEIYEGDIIAGKFNGEYIERTHWKGEPDIVAEVYWDYSGFRLRAKGKKDQRYADFQDFLLQEDWEGDRLLMLSNSHTEVIGNIHENPELINNIEKGK